MFPLSTPDSFEIGGAPWSSLRRAEHSLVGGLSARQLLGLEVTQGMLVGVSSPMTQQGVSARPSGTVPEPSPDTLGQTDTVCGLLERRNYRKKNPPRVI